MGGVGCGFPGRGNAARGSGGDARGREMVLVPCSWEWLVAVIVTIGMGVGVGVGLVFVRGFRGVRSNDVDFCAGETAANDLAELEARTYIERLGGLCQGIERDACIDQRAQQHIAANAGKTLEVANTHRVVILNG